MICRILQTTLYAGIMMVFIPVFHTHLMSEGLHIWRSNPSQEALYGAFYGFKAILERWLNAVKDRSQINELTEELISLKNQNMMCQ